MTHRRTIGRPVSLVGVGLHLGVTCELTLTPAPSGSGLRFRRRDLPGEPVVAVCAEAAILTERRTQLGTGDEALHTVEHLLAAVAGLGIDDLEMTLDGPEPPIADGSAAPYVALLEEAGLVEQMGRPDYLELAEPVRIVDGDSLYEAWPCDALEIEVAIDFPHPLIGAQSGRWRVTPDTFARELAPARTFGFVHEVEYLRSRGLIKGASTANAVVLDAVGLVETELRWPDEFVRHKAMDVVGDLALAGARVKARIVANRPSHRATVLLVQAMVAASSRASGSRPVRAERVRTSGAAASAAGTTVGTPGGTTTMTTRGIEEIMRVLPHRYPFLLVDRILEIEDGKRVVGLKNVTINEPFFQGHFPGHPIMPGVLIIEAMAQVGGMLLLGAVPDPEQKVVYFTSLNNVKFRRPVKPGDQLRFELDLLQVRGTMCKMSGVARVDGEVVAEAEMGAMVRDR